MKVKTHILVQLYNLSKKPVSKRRKLAIKQLAKILHKQMNKEVVKTDAQILGFVNYIYQKDYRLRQAVGYFNTPKNSS